MNMYFSIFVIISLFLFCYPQNIFAQESSSLTLGANAPTLRLDEELIFHGKLTDSEGYNISGAEISIFIPQFPLDKIIAKAITDVRGEFRVSVTSQYWYEEGVRGEFFAYFDGDEHYSSATSNPIYIMITKPRATGFEYEQEVESSSEEITKHDVESAIYEIEKEVDGGCLIATAAYGTELDPRVQNLREIRNKIYDTELGDMMKIVNAFYYTFSPTVSDWERENPVFRQAIKFLITPSVESFSMIDYTTINTEQNFVSSVVGLIFLNIGIYFVIPAAIVIKIKNTYKNYNSKESRPSL